MHPSALGVKNMVISHVKCHINSGEFMWRCEFELFVLIYISFRPLYPTKDFMNLVLTLSAFCLNYVLSR